MPNGQEKRQSAECGCCRLQRQTTDRPHKEGSRAVSATAAASVMVVVVVEAVQADSRSGQENSTRGQCTATVHTMTTLQTPLFPLRNRGKMLTDDNC